MGEKTVPAPGFPAEPIAQLLRSETAAVENYERNDSVLLEEAQHVDEEAELLVGALALHQLTGTAYSWTSSSDQEKAAELASAVEPAHGVDPCDLASQRGEVGVSSDASEGRQQTLDAHRPSTSRVEEKVTRSRRWKPGNERWLSA